MGADLYFMGRQHDERQFPLLREAVRKALIMLEKGEIEKAKELLKWAKCDAEFKP